MRTFLRSKSSRVVAAAALTTGLALATPALASPASAATCSGTIYLYEGVNYTGAILAAISVPTLNTPVHVHGVSSAKNVSGCSVVLKRSSGGQLVAPANGGIKAITGTITYVTNG